MRLDSLTTAKAALAKDTPGQRNDNKRANPTAEDQMNRANERGEMTYRMFAVFNKADRLVPGVGVHCMASSARRAATEGLMSAVRYHELPNAKARWREVAKRGYRVKPVQVIA